LPHHKSAVKRIRQDKRRRAANRAVKSEVKSAAKKVMDATGVELAEKELRQASSIIDRAAKKHVIHWRTAARKKSRLARRVKAKAG
jgi:small subunit ribosomal protein S20